MTWRERRGREEMRVKEREGGKEDEVESRGWIYERRNTSRRAIGNDATQKIEERRSGKWTRCVSKDVALTSVFSRRHRQRRHCLRLSAELARVTFIIASFSVCNNVCRPRGGKRRIALDDSEYLWTRRVKKRGDKDREERFPPSPLSQTSALPRRVGIEEEENVTVIIDCLNRDVTNSRPLGI